MTSEIKVDTISEQTSANGVTIDGLTIKDGNIIGDVALAGTTPTFTVGDGGAEDASLIFDGNAQDFYVALDDSADDLVIGLGSTVGTTPIMSFDESKNVTIHDGTLTVESDNANALMAPLLKLDRISSSPADGDLIGAIRYTARLDSGSSAEFAGLEAKIIESSTADGEITLNIAKGGNVRSALKANNTEVIINDASEDLDFRVESDGNTHALFVDAGNDVVGINTSNPSASWVGANNLVISDTSSDGGITIISGTSGNGNIMFSDAQAGAFSDARGLITYLHNGDSMRFITANAEAMRIDSSQRLGIGTSSPSAKLHLDIGTDNLGLYVNSTDATAGFALADNGGSINLATTSSGAFRIMTGGSANTAADGSAVSMLIDASGAVTKPLQPAFLVTPASDQTSLANNDTIVFGTEIFDQNADFASNTFTAPVTGRYLLSFALRLELIQENTTYALFSLVTSNRSYQNIFDSSTSDSTIDFRSFTMSILADMDANDTVTVVFGEAGGSTGQTRVSEAESFFSGVLVC